MDTDPRYPMAPCPECHIGSLRPGRAFFCATLWGQFISAPGFPAWICDVCGRCEYDQTSVRVLENLVKSRGAGRRGRRRAGQVGPSDGGASGTSRPRGTK